MGKSNCRWTEGVLKEENGQIVNDGAINATQSTVHKLLQNLVENNYDIDAFGNKENWLSVQYEAVNADNVMPKLIDIYRNTNQEIRELFNSPSSKGSDVVWAGLAMDSMTKNNEIQETKGTIQ